MVLLLFLVSLMSEKKGTPYSEFFKGLCLNGKSLEVIPATKMSTSKILPAKPLQINKTCGHWKVYLVLCADGTYYCGVTTDLERRVREHNSSNKGSKYCRSRRPVKLMYSESHDDRSSAQKRECAVKRLTHNEKSQLIRGNSAFTWAP